MMALHSAAARRRKAQVETSELPAGKHAHGTQEWAAQNVNIQLGCENDCRYCYAKSMSIRFKRSTSCGWQSPKIDKDKVIRDYRKKSGRTMFPSTHDITPSNLQDYLTVLKSLLSHGNDVLIVSKPHLECLKTLCRECSGFRKQILYRFTIGSIHDGTLKYWEPAAPSYTERLDSLKWAFFEGFSTSVSVEPMLDRDVSELVAAVRPFVTDSIWIGRVNRLGAAISINCPGDIEAQERSRSLLDSQNDQWVRELYKCYRNDPKVKWKDSIKKIVGLERPTQAGLDI